MQDIQTSWCFVLGVFLHTLVIPIHSKVEGEHLLGQYDKSWLK